MTKENKQAVSTLLAFAIIPLSGFATDIYLPSLPQMGIALNVSSLQVQMTISIFLISYGFSQLFIGAVLDSFGRYRLGLAALIVFAIASTLIGITKNIYLIYAMRAVHGITVATIVVAKRAYFVDVYTGEKLKNYLSLFTIIWSVGPIVAPFIGGYLQSSFGWNVNFYLLAGLAIIIAVLEILFSGETLTTPTGFNLKKIALVYYELITTASFTLGLAMLGFAYSIVMVFNLTGPFIIEHHLHFSAVTVGYCSLILGISWMLGGFTGKASINQPFFKRLLINLLLQCIFVAAMLVSLGIWESLFSLIFFAFIIHATAGFTYNNYFTFSMGQFPKHAGIAGGLIGGVVYIIVSSLTYVIVYCIPAKNERNLSYSYLVLVLLSAATMYFIFKIKKKESLPAITA